jgi:predicted kinase
MLVHLNGLPGVGKLTIGRIVAETLGGRILDNHSIYNVAFALTDFRSDAFYETVRAVRRIAYERLLELPADLPIVLTNAHFDDSAWGNECWDAAIDLARQRGSAHCVVVLTCGLAAHEMRIAGPDRALKRKPQDFSVFKPGMRTPRPIDRGADRLLHLDTTGLTAEASANAIVDWLRG